MAKRANNERDRTPARRVQAPDQNADRAAIGNTAAMLFWALLASGQSTCARSMAGRRLQQNLPISQLTSLLDRVLSKCRRSRHPEFQHQSRRHLQINRKRQIDDIKMNFITKWSVDRLQFLTFATVQAQQNFSTPQFVSEQIVSNVTFDNSNVPGAVLSKERLTTILMEALGMVSKQQQETHLQLEGF